MLVKLIHEKGVYYTNSHPQVPQHLLPQEVLRSHLIPALSMRQPGAVHIFAFLL